MSRTMEQRNGKREEKNQQKHEKHETLIRKTKKNIIFMLQKYIKNRESKTSRLVEQRNRK